MRQLFTTGNESCYRAKITYQVRSTSKPVTVYLGPYAHAGVARSQGESYRTFYPQAQITVQRCDGPWSEV